MDSPWWGGGVCTRLTPRPHLMSLSPQFCRLIKQVSSSGRHQGLGAPAVRDSDLQSAGTGRASCATDPAQSVRSPGPRRGRQREPSGPPPPDWLRGDRGGAGVQTRPRPPQPLPPAPGPGPRGPHSPYPARRAACVSEASFLLKMSGFVWGWGGGAGAAALGRIKIPGAPAAAATRLPRDSTFAITVKYP